MTAIMIKEMVSVANKENFKFQNRLDRLENRLNEALNENDNLKAELQKSVLEDQLMQTKVSRTG